MLNRFFRNRQNRSAYAKIEIEILAFRYLIKTQKLNFNIRFLASIYLSRYRGSSSYRTRLANHCFLSSRRRGFIRFSGLSRQQMRLLARDGKLPYINKVS